MSLALYMDVHVAYPITAGLISRGVDVLTAQMDHATRLPDPQLLGQAGPRTVAVRSGSQAVAMSEFHPESET